MTKKKSEIVRHYDKSGHRCDIHTIRFFDPTAYKVVGYFDLDSPHKMYQNVGQSKTFAHISQDDRDKIVKDMQEKSKNAEKDWHKRKEELFGKRANLRLFCDHCGQQNVRFVVALEHNETKERIAIGWACAENKLNLSLDQYQVRYLRNEAIQAKKQYEIELFKHMFALDHPILFHYLMGELAIPIDSYDFYHVNSFKKYGMLKQYQIDHLEKKVDKMVERYQAQQEMKAKGITVIVGEQGHSLEGQIESLALRINALKEKVGKFGPYIGAMCKDSFGNKYWFALPKKFVGNKTAYEMKVDYIGKEIIIRGTFKNSPDDKMLSFGSYVTVVEN